MRSLIAFVFCVFTLPGYPGEIDRDFYAFQNGVKAATPEERIAWLKELGYDGIGSARPDNLEKRLTLYDEAGLKIYSVYLGGRLTTGKSAMRPRIQNAIADLKGRDVTIELFVQGTDQNTDEEAVTFVREVADLAGDSGLEVVLYPHSGFYIDTLSDAVRIAKKSERKNIGVMFNLCHFLKVEPKSDLRKTLTKAKPLLKQVSICGADIDGPSWKQLIRPLDEGSFDQKQLITILDEIGFQGPIGLQCFGIAGNPKDNLARSIAAWKEISE